MLPDPTVNAFFVCSVAAVALLISEYFRVPQRLRRILGARARDGVNSSMEAAEVAAVLGTKKPSSQT